MIWLAWRRLARLIELIDSWLSWWAKRLLLSLSLFNIWLSKSLLSLDTQRTNGSARVCWVGLPTDSWLGTSNEQSLTPTNSARICWAAALQLSKDLLSLQSTNSPRVCMLSLRSTNSARVCWSFTPQTQQGFAEPLLHKFSKSLLSLRSTGSMYTTQWLSIEGVESGSTTDMYTAQWLSIEGAESGSTTGHSNSAQKALSWAPKGYMYRKGFGSLAEPIGFFKIVGWWAYEPPIKRSPPL